jgi:geranyl-CoA carboxylase alpha subunit
VPRLSKILIANRGEIAVRIARTARALGLATVAVYSDPDRASPHVEACDEAVALVGATAAESYLSIERMLAAARRSGADGVHPGYGFLAENADFADACAAAGLVFIGPPASAIRQMGNKAGAKAHMRASGVPCVPGFEGAQDDATLIDAARDIGFPVMIKAAAGGGGKGMRRVESPREFPAALEATRSEAMRAFGSGELLLEKALEAPRHVEVQVFADTFGTTIHLGERDCSIQRRHQKIVEEAPSPAAGADLRERMGLAAVEAARAVGYAGAGTVEFLLDRSGAFYFLEMNTRLQVEHAVTEAIEGIDLVAWQFRVAMGEALPLDEPRGPRAAHAIEARLYAEDPAHGFLPQAGEIVQWIAPSGEGIRVDHALAPGLVISPYYDPMLAKVVASGADRDEARRRLVRALEDLTLFGITNNRQFLIACLLHPAFVAGDVQTDFVPRYFGELARAEEAAFELDLIPLASVLLYLRDTHGAAGFRSSGTATALLKLRSGENVVTVALSTSAKNEFTVSIAGERRLLHIVDRDDGSVRFSQDGIERSARFGFAGSLLYLQCGRTERSVTDVSFIANAERADASRGSATSPMPGIVATVSVAVGDAVAKGQTLVTLEAMKMLHEIVAGAAGRVSNVLVAPGQQVGMRAVLVEIDGGTT